MNTPDILNKMRNQRLPLIFLTLYFLIPLLILPLGRDTYTEWIFPRVILVFLLGLAGLLLFRQEFLKINRIALIGASGYLALVLLSDLSSPDELVFRVVGHEERYDGLIYQIGKTLAFLTAVVTLRKLRQTHADFAYRLVGTGFFVIASIQALLLATQFFLKTDMIGFLLYEGQKNTAPIGTVGFKVLLILSIGTGLLFALVEYSKGWNLAPIFLAFMAGLAAGRASAIGLVTSLVSGAWLYFNKRKAGKALLFLAAATTFSLAFVFRNEILSPFGVQPVKVLSARTLKTRFVIWKITGRLLETHRWLVIRGYGSDAMRYLLIENLPKDERLKKLYIESMVMENKLPADKVENLEIVTQKEYGLRATALHLVYRTQQEPDRTKHFLAAVNLDKAHNLWLDLWLRYGLLATILYTILAFGPFFYLARRLLKSQLDDWWPRAATWVVLALMAHGIHYLAWFPMPLWEPLFLLIAALGWDLVDYKR